MIPCRAQASSTQLFQHLPTAIDSMWVLDSCRRAVLRIVGDVHVGPGAVPPAAAEVGKFESANVVAGGHEDGGATPYNTANAGSISFSEPPADTSRPLSPCARLKADPNGEPVLCFDLPVPGPLDLSTTGALDGDDEVATVVVDFPDGSKTPGINVEAVLRQEADNLNDQDADDLNDQDADDLNDLHSATDEELMAMALPEPTTKPSGFYYGLWLDKRLTYNDKSALKELGAIYLGRHHKHKFKFNRWKDFADRYYRSRTQRLNNHSDTSSSERPPLIDPELFKPENAKSDDQKFLIYHHLYHQYLLLEYTYSQTQPNSETSSSTNRPC